MFTGGEPTLNLDAMEHMAEGLINRGVLLFNFQVITNGVEYSERLVEVARPCLKNKHCTNTEYRIL